ncbi:biotin--[acetyl-CoA-carboxylase] ligase [Calorimonas adulescens]|jgi:birA, biotin-[acetyl-CoA-carboxylase] ligase region|uniref:Bifunctional ligase/repressor BirA n=1 Tax=Calorimonas adulescens TaxID=2606906 RepID=A0A5D8QAT0_9THEO|nr:biotin--[acetyl-CoA-carboxylase] ligase [Calorimonas adulescens]TZE81572.1 biotin--[acetyl-CoA-carboxylase] ligase [Calorimonas adulescens]
MDKLLEILMEKRGKYISGEELSSILGITRTAVWKRINALRERGFDIKAETKNGYMLQQAPDLLLPDLVGFYLKTDVLGREIVYYDSIGSTNEVAKGLAIGNCDEGTIVVAEEQVSGRGRISRGWYSPKFEGIYCSIILKPSVPISEIPKLTQLIGLGIARALQKRGINPLIKWPNDIVVNGKKVCGILTEMAAEMDAVHYVITGFGLNVNNRRIPGEISSIATSLYLESGEEFYRPELLASILKEIEIIYTAYKGGDYNGFISEVKSMSATIGRKVRVINGRMEYTGTAVDILPSGALLIEHDDGELTEAQAGDVSVRGVMGYA